MKKTTLGLILAIGAVFRFYSNTAMALWHDEAFSALYLRYDWGEMMHRIGLDVHPPLYYIVLRIWSYILGDGLLSLRLLSILFGVLTIWAGYAFVKTAFRNQNLALVSALVLAVNPFQIQYALEARMYTLGTFLALWSSYLLVRALDNKKYWIWYALAAAAMFYTHYFLFFTVAAQGIFVLLHFLRSRKIQTLFWAGVSYILALLLYAPWLPTLLAQVKRVQENFWIPPIERWSVPGTIWKMVFGGIGIQNSVLAISMVVAVLLLIHFVKKVGNFQKWHVFLGVLGPLAGAVLLSIRSDLYLDRYFVFASAYFSILIVMGFWYSRRKTLGYILIALLIASTGFAFFKNWSDLKINAKPGMARAAERINLAAKPGDKIYSGSSFIFFTFKYYNHTSIAPQLISSQPLEEIPHFSGTAILTPDDLVLSLDNEQPGQTVWLMWTTGFGGSKPVLPGNWKELSSQTYDDAPDFKGTIFIEEYLVSAD